MRPLQSLRLEAKKYSLILSYMKLGRGGGVSQYGLAASQLVRIRKAGIRLTVCVDTVAASGGYSKYTMKPKQSIIFFCLFQILVEQFFVSVPLIHVFLCFLSFYLSSIY